MAATVATVIMAHPTRARFVRELLPHLPKDTEVVWDRINNRWDTGRRTLLRGAELALANDRTHVLLVQDDATLCDQFIEVAIAACTCSGNHPVSFYLGSLSNHNPALIRSGVRKAKRKGIPWVQMAGPWWGVSFAVPVEHVDQIVKHGDQSTITKNFDLRVAAWYRSVDISCWYTVPSLVNHRGVHENPSLVEGRTANRQATWCIEGSPSQAQWDTDPVVVHGRRPGVESEAMAYVVIDGEGTYRVGRWLFKPGATEVPADDPVLDFIKDRGPKWVQVQETRKAPEPTPPPPPAPPKPTPPLEPFQNREDDKWYFVHHITGMQQGPFDTREAAATTAAEERNSIPLSKDLGRVGGAGSGTLTMDDMPERNKDGYACPECGKLHRTTAARDNHRRIRHPEVFQHHSV